MVVLHLVKKPWFPQSRGIKGGKKLQRIYVVAMHSTVCMDSIEYFSQCKPQQYCFPLHRILPERIGNVHLCIDFFDFCLSVVLFCSSYCILSSINILLVSNWLLALLHCSRSMYLINKWIWSIFAPKRSQMKWLITGMWVLMFSMPKYLPFDWVSQAVHHLGLHSSCPKFKLMNAHLQPNVHTFCYFNMNQNCIGKVCPINVIRFMSLFLKS